MANFDENDINDSGGGDWYAYEKGVTVGQAGPEGGMVLRDEEYGDANDAEDADARLTLEKTRTNDTSARATTHAKAFTITANLYGGWMLHVAGFDAEADALRAYDAMKQELETLADLIPDETDRDIDTGMRRLTEAVTAFEERHP